MSIRKQKLTPTTLKSSQQVLWLSHGDNSPIKKSIHENNKDSYEFVFISKMGIPLKNAITEPEDSDKTTAKESVTSVKA